MSPKNITYFIILALSLTFGGCRHAAEEEEHEDDHHSQSSAIHLEPQQAAQFGIEYDTLSPSPFHEVIKTSGAIEASNSDIYTITAKKSGIVKLSAGITAGVNLKAGQSIGSVSSEGLQRVETTQSVMANLKIAKAEYERLKPLYEDNLVTASAFKEAERAYREAEALAAGDRASGSSSLVSTAGGSIRNLFVNSGDYVETGAPIATVAQNNNLVLRADLPTRLSRYLPDIVSANFIPDGGLSLVKLRDLDGKRISGNTPAGASNGYIPVYFSFSGNSFATPGGFAEVYLITGERPNVLSLPRSALVEIQGNKYAYVAIDDHSYEKRLVETGGTDGERVEILGGLNPGEKVVTKGASVIRMAELSTISPPAHTHNH